MEENAAVDSSNGSGSVDEEARALFSLRSIMAATAVVALVIAMRPVTSVGSGIVLASIGLTFFFGDRSTRRAICFIVPVLYLPYVWLFWDWHNYPWHGYRWSWIAMVWQLPGLLAEIPMHPLSDGWFTFVTTSATLAILFTLITIARLNLRSTIIVTVIALLLSSLNSALCLALYRA